MLHYLITPGNSSVNIYHILKRNYIKKEFDKLEANLTVKKVIEREYWRVDEGSNCEWKQSIQREENKQYFLPMDGHFWRKNGGVSKYLKRENQRNHYWSNEIWSQCLGIEGEG